MFHKHYSPVKGSMVMTTMMSTAMKKKDFGTVYLVMTTTMSMVMRIMMNMVMRIQKKEKFILNIGQTIHGIVFIQMI